MEEMTIEEQREAVVLAFKESMIAGINDMFKNYPREMIEVCEGKRRLQCSLDGDAITMITKMNKEPSNIITSL